MVVGLAVGVALPLEEVPRAQLLVAVGAGEVFRVPRLPQRGDHLKIEEFRGLISGLTARRTGPLLISIYLSDDRLLAGAAASLLSGVDALTTHVCLEVP